MFRFNHDGLPMASTASGSLRLSEDDKGLAFEADIDLQETDAANMWRKLERGILRQTSILGALVQGGVERRPQVPRPALDHPGPRRRERRELRHEPPREAC